MPIWNIRKARIQQFSVFQAIYTLRSLTSAADQLQMTQSAVSKQLKLLRLHFGDELFVRTAAGMEPTSRAMEIEPGIQSILTEVDALQGEVALDAATLKTRFVISTSDEIQQFLLPNLLQFLDDEAPGARVAFRTLDREFAARDLETGQVSLLVTADWNIPEHFIQRHLYEEDFVCLFRKDHPLAQGTLTLERFVRAAHMMVAPHGREHGVVDDELAKLGLRRFVRLSVPTFMQVDKILNQSDMIVTLPRKIANTVMRNTPLELREVPIEIPKFSYFMFWHKRYDQDRERRWFRGLVMRAMLSAA